MDTKNDFLEGFLHLYPKQERHFIEQFLDYMEYYSLLDIPDNRDKMFEEMTKIKKGDFDFNRLSRYVNLLLRITEYRNDYVHGNLKLKPLSRKQILEICEKLQSYRDKALLLGVYEGICGDNLSEIGSLKITDLRNHKVFIQSRNYEIPVSDVLIMFLEKANEEKFVYSLSPGSNFQGELKDDGTILKNLGSNSDRKFRSLKLRLIHIFQFAGIQPPTLTQLKDFGKLDYIFENAKDPEVVLKEWLNDDRRAEFERQFGVSNFNKTIFIRRLSQYDLESFRNQKRTRAGAN